VDPFLNPLEIYQNYKLCKYIFIYLLIYLFIYLFIFNIKKLLIYYIYIYLNNFTYIYRSLAYNKLSGSIPESIGNISTLEIM